jgi:hypothetical protein
MVLKMTTTPLYQVYVSGVTLGSLTEGRNDDYLEAGVHLGTYDSLEAAKDRLHHMKDFLLKIEAVLPTGNGDWEDYAELCWRAWSRYITLDSQGNDHHRAYIWIKQCNLNQDVDGWEWWSQ